MGKCLFLVLVVFLGGITILHAQVEYQWTSATVFGRSQDEAEEPLAYQGQLIASALSLGLDFEYRPLDIRRGQEESIELSIPEGTNRLDHSYTIVVDEDGSLRAEHKLNVPDSMDRWKQARIDSSAAYFGSGTQWGSDWSSATDGSDVLRELLRRIIRNELRNRIGTKPQRVMGTIYFHNPPEFSFASGVNGAQVRMSFIVKQVQEFLN